MPTSAQATVVITSYNHAAFIETAMRSVLNQTCRDFELCIVDDGSTDDTHAIIERILAQTQTQATLIRQENRGQANAWNTAFQNTSAPIVFLLDGDDEWQPEKLETMLTFIREHPDAALYQHRLHGDTRPPDRFGNGDLLSHWKQLGTPLNLAVHGPAIAQFVPSSGLAIRREILDQITPIPETLVTCPDAFLTRTALAHGPVCALDTLLGTWRDHPGNAGKEPRYSFENYWVPTVMPAINQWYATHSIGLQFTYAPTSLRARLRMKLKSITGKVGETRP